MVKEKLNIESKVKIFFKKKKLDVNLGVKQHKEKKQPFGCKLHSII